MIITMLTMCFFSDYAKKKWFQGYDDDDDDKLFLKKNIFPLHNLYNIFSFPFFHCVHHQHWKSFCIVRQSDAIVH
ncbi:hypothetical protein DERP_008938 [Dermatophagoides pteronyssinus]|uniref:Uncharacterized protein n=1 Tax=Dermatophagoides pteronyssinus TaxID=6956 RepID=A0ABQ8JP00_DERPT|nr:hypothetical protein DERP_008938 [Dermatophagoides pteronyssinus]